jgi:hypothetical protein
MSVKCAWCMVEDEEDPQEESHGICDDHAEMVLLDYYQGKFDSVPSYCERFADERETDN